MKGATGLTTLIIIEARKKPPEKTLSLFLRYYC